MKTYFLEGFHIVSGSYLDYIVVNMRNMSSVNVPA